MKAQNLPKLIISALFLFIYITLINAQNVAVNATGATADNSAMLDVSANNKGLLVPRVPLIHNMDDATVNLPATSLLVWNTNEEMKDAYGTGYYYNAGKPQSPLWTKLAPQDSLANAWLIRGNKNIIAGEHFIGTTNNQDVIFKQNNIESIRITAGGALLATGNTNIGITPVSGPGRRMMWIPAKAAFRAGRVLDAHWDDVNIGNYSVAMGNSSSASGESSTAMGNGTTASSYATTAMGHGTKAVGGYSTAMGSSTTASGTYSTAMGFVTDASGNSSTAMGEGTLARIKSQLVIGRYNRDTLDEGTEVISTQKVFVIGNGTYDNRSDAMFVRRDGRVTISGTLTQNSDIRLKENITPLKDVLNTLSIIQPISYYFKDKEKHPASRQIGFSAQEIEKTYPELVSEGDAGYLSVNYPQMAAVAIQAVKELKAENDEVKKQLKALQDEMIELKKSIRQAQ